MKPFPERDINPPEAYDQYDAEPLGPRCGGCDEPATCTCVCCSHPESDSCCVECCACTNPASSPFVPCLQPGCAALKSFPQHGDPMAASTTPRPPMPLVDAATHIPTGPNHTQPTWTATGPVGTPHPIDLCSIDLCDECTNPFLAEDLHPIALTDGTVLNCWPCIEKRRDLGLSA